MEQEKYSHVLVDVQSSDVISHEKICLMEKERRNAEAMAVGEFFLIWMPLSILHNVQAQGQAEFVELSFELPVALAAMMNIEKSPCPLVPCSALLFFTIVFAC